MSKIAKGLFFLFLMVGSVGCYEKQHDRVGLIMNKHEEPVKNHIYHWLTLSHYTDTFKIDVSEDDYNTYQIGEVFPHGVCYIP